MTKKRDDRFAQAAKDIDINIGKLIGNLGEAVNEIINRLDDGKSGEVTREHVFDTANGPIRAQAGVRLRMGGLGGDTQAGPRRPRPVNPDRTARSAPSVAPRALDYDLIEDEDCWILTADLPGVSTDELILSQDGAVLSVATRGSRRYAADIKVASPFQLDDTAATLRNGILELRLPKVDPV